MATTSREAADAHDRFADAATSVDSAPSDAGPTERAEPSATGVAVLRSPYLRSKWRIVWPPLLVIAVLIGAWVFAVRVAKVQPYMLPSPSDTLDTAFDFEQYDWWHHTAVTAAEVLLGFMIATVCGIAIGFAITWSDLARRAFMPLMIVFNTLPKISIAPLFIVWLGYGIFPNAIIAAALAFFAYVVNTSVGLMQVDRDLVELFRVLRAPKWRVFLTVRLPTAVPYITSAMKLGTVGAVIGAVVGEFLAAQAGLGYVITFSMSSIDTHVTFAAIFWISILGMIVYGVAVLVERLALAAMHESDPVV